MLGALAATGYGVAALVFAFVDVLPFGWRGLYALALLPLAIVIPLRQVLPETQRFAQSNPAQEGAHLRLPFVTLWTQYPDRLWRLGSVAFLAPLGSAAGGFFTAKYLQEVHQWLPAHVSSLYVLGGAVGILGNIVAGRLSDRIGRRTLGALCLGIAPAFTLLFFNSAGSVLALAWVGFLFVDTASSTILNTYSAELFPTTARTTAGSVLTAVGTLGGAVRLLLESWLYTHLGSHWKAISSLTGFWLLSSLIVAFSFPETAGQELETLTPEEREGATQG
jgi:putative MFS transporter